MSLLRQRAWHFLVERHYSIIPPPSSANCQAAQHCTFSALWSKVLCKRLNVVSNWKRHSTAFPPFLQSVWLFSNINKNFCFCNLTSNSILSPKFQAFDDKLGILNFTDPNQCWTQKKAQCPMVILEHDYFWTETTEHKHSCKGLVPLPEDRLYIPNVSKSHRHQAQIALLIWNKVMSHLVFKDSKSTNTSKIK